MENYPSNITLKVEAGFDPATPVVEHRTGSCKTVPGLPLQTIQCLKDGSHEAFEEVFHTFYPRVKSFLKVLCKSEDMADELSQKVFVNLWLYRSSIDIRRNFNAYIYTIARNAAMSAFRSQLKDEGNPFDLAGDDGTAADDLVIARETELLVQLTVGRMPPKRRRVYEMSRYEDKDNEQISRELNISRKVVEKHLRLALNEIREVVKVMTVLFFN